MELAIEAGSAIPEQEAWALTRYGTLLVAANRTTDAEAAFRHALRLSPGYVHARAGLARVAAARGRFGEATQRLRAVVDRLPVPEYAILLGDVLARDGRPLIARRAYALVSTLDRILAANGVRTELQTALFDLDRGIGISRALARARAAYRAAPGHRGCGCCGLGPRAARALRRGAPLVRARARPRDEGRAIPVPSRHDRALPAW